MPRLNLMALALAATLVVLGPPTHADDHRTMLDNQTSVGSTEAKLTSLQTSPQLSSNMSALMSAAPVQTMTNGSIAAMMGQQQQVSPQMQAVANQSSTAQPADAARQNQTANGNGQTPQAKFSATKGGQPTASRGPSVNPPAYNSRQRTAAQPYRTDQQVARQQRLGGSQLDNQMAADDMHETQAFMPGIREEESKPARNQGGGRPQASTSSSMEVSQPQAMTMVNGGGKSLSAGQAGSNKQPAGKSLAQQSAAEGWQVVSASVPNSGPVGSSWPPRPRGGSAGQRHLPPPPPPVNYNVYRQYMPEQSNAGVYQTAAGDQLDATQLERPYAGYSYGAPAYTHTAQLAPVRQELEMADMRGVTSAAVKQRQRQYAPPPEQLARSSSTAGGHLEQQQILPPRQGPANQLPHFHATSSSVHYSQAAAQSSGAQQHKQQVQLVMMPGPPVPPVTGTSSNPCKPPPLLQLGLQHQQLQEQQLLANDLASAASSGQASLGLPRYVRLGEGTRLRSQFIFKVLRADSLTDCELACARASAAAGGNPLDTCRAFNYRAYFAAENCELSRSDALQLKLDEPGQFEQHTQFDFYALAGGQAGLTASQSASQQALAQLQQAPIVQQQVGAPYTPAAPSGQEADCLDVSQSCSQDGMEFTLRTLEPFMGRIYTYGFYESCYLDGEGQTSSTLKISRSNGFPRCGTQQIGDLMTNIVVVQFNDHVQTTRDKKYNLTCYFSGPGEAVVTSSYFDTKLDERSHPMQIEHLPPQNVITSNVQLRILHHGTPTNTIAVGDLLTFRLETQAAGAAAAAGQSSSGVKQGRAAANGERQHEIFATNVIAKDPYSGRQVQLIDGRGCPVDPVNVFPELQRTTDGALESEFYAFKMPDSNFLIFQATVRACKSPCEPVICHRPAGGVASLLAGGGPLSQQYQMGGGAGLKGGAGQLGAYLMAATQQNAVPSWGRRRRRKRQSLHASDADADLAESDDELLGVGESVEHVIPARLVAGGSSRHPAQSARPIERIRRPELSEAEEEVKEMFRVYLTRAEINNKRRLAQQQQLNEMAPDPRPGPVAGNSSSADSWRLADAASSAGDANAEPDSQVCVTQLGYYVMLFSIISLSLVVLSVLGVALYISRQAKFHMSETLADAMF